MAQAPRKKPKRQPEPLNWKELAAGPALRGLSEVLATPAGTAKDRAARRLALDREDDPTETPTVAETPAEVDVAPDRGSFVEIETPTVEETPAVVEAQPVEEFPTVGESPKVLRVGATPTVVDLLTVDDPSGLVDSPTVGELIDSGDDLIDDIDSESISEIKTVGVSPSVADFQGEGDSTTDGESPAVGGVVSWKNAEPSPTRTSTVGESTTVGVKSWVDATGAVYEGRKVLRIQSALHSLTLGEERFYQSVWHAREADGVRPDGPRSKVFSMGYDRLAKLVRLDEKSVRQLIPKLVAKQALEVLAGEDSSARIGRTYRIFEAGEILERQQAENMLFVIKKGRAVEFVWPRGEGPSAFPRNSTVPVSATAGESPTVGKTPTVELSRVARPASEDDPATRTILEALSEFAPADSEAAGLLVAGARRHVPDATIDEIVHFIREKGRLARAGKIANPLVYLLVYVPKCFAGEDLQRLRAERQRAREQEEAAARQAREDLAQLRGEWQAWLSDPQVPEEEKTWVRRMLAGR